MVEPSQYCQVIILQLKIKNNNKNENTTKKLLENENYQYIEVEIQQFSLCFIVLPHNGHCQLAWMNEWAM